MSHHATQTDTVSYHITITDDTTAADAETSAQRAAVRQFAAALLESGAAEAVLAPVPLKTKQNVVPALIRTPAKARTIDPFAPVLPVSTATVVSNLTKIEGARHRTAVFVRSCELRALIELLKLSQASLENIVTVGVDCRGTYPITDYAAAPPTLAAAADPDPERLRSACRVCPYPSLAPHATAMGVDITIGTIGVGTDTGTGGGDGIIVTGHSPTGTELLGAVAQREGTEGTPAMRMRKLAADDDLIGAHAAAVKELTEARTAAAAACAAAFHDDVDGLDALLEFLAPCINCHNCMTVCPVCYCRECFFESATFEVPAEKYHAWAGAKGQIRLPTDTLLYHLTRMTHMITSCVACGMCEQACPSGIELLKLYATVGAEAQATFEYRPGLDPEAPLPMTTYRENELQPK